jgi:acetyl/propionyl-CoA carboxylase alpha subunit
MEYKLKYNEEVIALAVETAGDGRLSAAMGDKKMEVAFARISENQMRLIVDGRQTMAYLAELPEGKAVMVEGRAFMLADARATGTRPRSGAANAPKLVTPPMPAVVTQILVSPGQAVEKGQGVIVVSAMKMDTILSAPYAGVVARINVAEGEKVAPKQVLVDIEPAAVKEEAHG